MDCKKETLDKIGHYNISSFIKNIGKILSSTFRNFYGLNSNTSRSLTTTDVNNISSSEGSFGIRFKTNKNSAPATKVDHVLK